MGKLNEIFNVVVDYVANVIPIPVIVGAFLLIIAILYIISDVTAKRRRKSHALTYIYFFEESFDKTHNIEKTLRSIRKNYRSHSIEYKMISDALNYLDNSMLRDYESALGLISKEFKCTQVDDMHGKYIALESEFAKQAKDDIAAQAETSQESPSETLEPVLEEVQDED